MKESIVDNPFSWAASCAATETSVPPAVLQGVQVKHDGTKTTYAATDCHVLAVVNTTRDLHPVGLFNAKTHAAIEGNFPNYGQVVIPRADDAVTVWLDEFLPYVIAADAGRRACASKEEDSGTWCLPFGPDATVYINPALLLRPLRAVNLRGSRSRLAVTVGGPLQPVRIDLLGLDAFVIVMPVKVRTGMLCAVDLRSVLGDAERVPA